MGRRVRVLVPVPPGQSLVFEEVESHHEQSAILLVRLDYLTPNTINAPIIHRVVFEARFRAREAIPN